MLTAERPRFLFSVGFHMLGGHFPAWVLTLILGIILAAVVFFTSKNDEQPKYHAVSNVFIYLLYITHHVMRNSIYCN